MKKKQLTELLLFAGMGTTIVLELLLLKYFNVFETMGMKDAIIAALLMSLYGVVLSKTLDQHPALERGQFTRQEKRKLILAGVVVLPTIVTIMIVVFSKVS